MLTIAAEVGAPTLCQLCPPSTVRATTPSGPPAYATAPDAGASVTKEPAILLPIGRQVAPASSEISTLPDAPAAIARVGEANSTAYVGSVEGTIDENVSPPSIVRRIWLPSRVATRQVCGPLHLIFVRSPGGAPTTGRDAQEAPPSTLLSTVKPAPTA